MKKEVIVILVFLILLTSIGIYNQIAQKQSVTITIDPEEPFECSDSDGGSNFGTKGAITFNQTILINGKPFGGENIFYEDYCVVSNERYDVGNIFIGNITESCSGENCYVNEYKCVKGEIFEYSQCSNGCEDGACV